MTNDDNTTLTNLWVAGVLPWQVSLPWYYPTFTRIDNEEQ
jgi:hypothetical protein